MKPSKTQAPRPTEPTLHSCIRWRVLVVDDHPMTRYGVVQLINDEPDLVVCGEAEDGQQALAAIPSARPALVLADLTMPGKGGLDFIKEVQCLHPGLAVLVVSMHDEVLYAERVLRAGARGYLMKSEGGAKLLEAIREVLQGRVYVSKRMAATILDSLTRRPGGDGRRLGLLSDREFEIFQLLGQGLSTREIAQRLKLSSKTVSVHRLHIKQKLNLRTGPELLRLAVQWAAAQHLV